MDRAKVVALITRAGDDGRAEVCLFEHPLAGVQLPAGTIETGEDPVTAARREGSEETGLDPFAGATHLGVLHGEPARHLVHLPFAGATPDEWWVFTPDGGWLCWRCFWAPLDDARLLLTAQREWLDAALPALAAAMHPPAVHRAVHDPGVVTDVTIEIVFAAPLDGRAQVSWLEPNPPPGGSVRRAEVVAFTDDGRLVVVAEEGGAPSFPGGRREAGETLEETLRREVREEACAEVVAHELIGYQRFRLIEGDGFAAPTTDAIYWARVRCDAFEPQHETRTRRFLSMDEARALPLWRNPLTQRLLARAFAAEAAVAGLGPRPDTAGEHSRRDRR